MALSCQNSFSNAKRRVPLENLLLRYIIRIGNSQEHLRWINNHVLTPDEKRLWGYPIYDHPTHLRPRGYCCYPSQNSYIEMPSPNPGNQQCRCGKTLSLLQEDWYVDEYGCNYHAGKRYKNGPYKGLYTCCKGASKRDGCFHHPFHVSSQKNVDISDFVFVRNAFNRYRDPVNVFALDTEMVYTTSGMEVARVALVDITGRVVVDCHVKPQNPVIDYAYDYSHIKPEDLQGENAVSFAVAQNYLLERLNEGSILVGHGLHNDLLGLHIVHEKIVDTSVLFPHQKGFPFRQSLKDLALVYLENEVSHPFNFHDPVEDARICMALVIQKSFLYMKYNA